MKNSKIENLVKIIKLPKYDPDKVTILQVNVGDMPKEQVAKFLQALRDKLLDTPGTILDNVIFTACNDHVGWMKTEELCKDCPRYGFTRDEKIERIQNKIKERL